MYLKTMDIIKQCIFLYYWGPHTNTDNLIRNNKPTEIDSNIIEYELTGNNSNTVNIFFDRNSLNLSGWKTTDSYSNKVNFLISNIETNIPIKNGVFKIPREEDL